MKLECLNNIITDNLAIHIDLTDINSWNLNSGFTSFSLTKWTGAISDNLDLIDFGLTGFDNGRTNIMWSGITFTPNDSLFSMYRIGYNDVINPTTGNTGGVTAITRFDNYGITGITTGVTGNYFELDGGYLQGFFELDGYNYQLLPHRFINGITIETLLLIYPESQGIFYMMGTRAEDKYNPFYSGEFISGTTSFTGVTTSKDDFLEALVEEEVLNNSFGDFENKYRVEYSEAPPIDNIKGNVIAFELTQDKKLAYKYIDDSGNIITNKSNASIQYTGFTMLAISFKPDETIDDVDLLDCYERRTGKLMFYVNGRAMWIIDKFPEFFFRSFINEPEKQLGVPYSISWGGGSFGLKHSYHYDYQTYGLYTGQDTSYINSNFIVTNDPIPTECNPNPVIVELSGLTLSADSETFLIKDPCDPDIEESLTVMRVEYHPITGTTGTTYNSYLIKYDQPISVLSNREYMVNFSLYNDGFFRGFDENGSRVENRVSILVYGVDDIDIIDDVEYSYPLIVETVTEIDGIQLYPFPDRQEYQYIKDGVMYYGKTGIPVYTNGRLNDEDQTVFYGVESINGMVTGVNDWIPLKSTFKTKDNSGQQFISIGILIETTDTFNVGNPLFIYDFTYRGSDILVQDNRKDNLLIQQNFDSSFIGGIQKLRIYDKALTSPEILHNAVIESEANSDLGILVNKGGRIIYR